MATFLLVNLTAKQQRVLYRPTLRDRLKEEALQKNDIVAIENILNIDIIWISCYKIMTNQLSY